MSPRSVPSLVRSVCLAAVVIFVHAAPAAAQVTGRTEIGLQISFLQLDGLDATARSLGGRVTFDVTRWLGIEGEVDFYPRETVTLSNAIGFVPPYSIEYRRSRLEVLGGVRAGIRRGRLGLFGKVRPGLMSLDDGGVACTGPGCAVVLIATPRYRSEPAFDVGGIVEIYAAPGATVRLDLGDTIIRNRNNPPQCASCTTHNFTTRIGIGVRY